MDLAKYRKFIAAGLAAGFTALAAVVSDGSVSGDEWIFVAVSVLGALGVVFVPNKPKTE